MLCNSSQVTWLVCHTPHLDTSEPPTPEPRDSALPGDCDTLSRVTETVSQIHPGRPAGISPQTCSSELSFAGS